MNCKLCKNIIDIIDISIYIFCIIKCIGHCDSLKSRMRLARKKFLESSSRPFLTELGSLGVQDTQKQVGFVGRHEGKTRRSKFVVGWAEWHEEVDVNKHGRVVAVEEEEWGIGRYGKLLSGGWSAHENREEEMALASRAVTNFARNAKMWRHLAQLRNLHLCPRDLSLSFSIDTLSLSPVVCKLEMTNDILWQISINYQ